MIARILRVLSIVSNVFGYFYLGYALGNYFSKVPLQYIVSIGTATVVVCVVAILWAISYTGIWIELAERKRNLFFKWFLFLCVWPGILGTTTSLVRNKLKLSGELLPKYSAQRPMVRAKCASASASFLKSKPDFTTARKVRTFEYRREL